MPGPANLDSVATAPRSTAGRADPGETVLDRATALNRFLADVENRAFRIAQMALGDRDEALDVVQGAMLRLARNYGQRPGEEWPPLFFRILYNGIRDARRRRAVRTRLFGFVRGRFPGDEDEAGDPMEQVPGGGPDPARQSMADQAMQRLETALGNLPQRQQQAFVLRCLEGMDVSETAAVMGCSEGSVKTHYSRALHALRAKLDEVW